MKLEECREDFVMGVNWAKVCIPLYTSIRPSARGENCFEAGEVPPIPEYIQYIFASRKMAAGDDSGVSSDSDKEN